MNIHTYYLTMTLVLCNRRGVLDLTKFPVFFGFVSFLSFKPHCFILYHIISFNTQQVVLKCLRLSSSPVALDSLARTPLLSS